MPAVPFSYRQYPGNGAAVDFSVPFPYLLKAHVKVYIGYNLLDGTFSSELLDGSGFTWTSGTQIQLATPPTAGQTVTVIRQTPTESRLVDWSDGSNLIATDLDTADLQNLYVVQEQTDRSNLAIATANEAVTELNELTTYGGNYLGALAEDPAAQPGGGEIQEGNLYYNTTTSRFRVFGDGLWSDGAAPTTLFRWKKVAVGGETSLGGGDDNGQELAYTADFEQVYVNGTLLVRGVEYTAINGTSITGLTALTAGDVVEVISFNAFTIGVAPTEVDFTGLAAANQPIDDSDLFLLRQGTTNKKVTASIFRTELAAGAEAAQAAAELAETNALAAQAAAEAARDAAQLSSGVYASTAAGLAATTVGKYFSVPSASANEYLILYRHDAGPVATQIKVYPSVAGAFTGFQVKEYTSIVPQRSYFKAGEIFGSYHASDGALVTTPTWSINASGHLVIATGMSGSVTRYWKTGHYWDGNYPVRIKAKAAYTTNTNTVGVSVMVGNTGNNFTYAKNGVIGIYNSGGSPVTGKYTTVATMAYGPGEEAQMEVELNPDGTGVIRCTHPTSAETFELKFSGYNQTGPIGPAWRRSDAGVFTYFDVAHNLFSDKFSALSDSIGSVVNNAVIPSPLATIVGTYNARDNSALSPGTTAINSSGELQVTNAVSHNDIVYIDTGETWDGNITLSVSLEFTVNSTTAVNGGGCLVVGDLSNRVTFAWLTNGFVGVLNTVNSIISGTTVGGFDYAVGERVRMTVFLSPSGQTALTARRILTGESYTHSWVASSPPTGLVAAGIRRGPTNITFHEISYPGITSESIASLIAQEIGPVEDRVAVLEQKVSNVSAETLVSQALAGVDRPNGFTFNPGFRIYRSAFAQGYTTDYVPTLLSATNIYYVNPKIGNDSTGTGSNANPFATVAKAFTRMNADAVPATIYLASGEYSYLGVGAIPTPTQKFNLVCPDKEPAVLTRTSTETGWALTPGYTNVWEKDITTGAAPVWGWDNANLDSYGEAIPFTVQLSIANVNANPGSIRIEGTKAYVHTFNSRQPDANVRILRSEAGLYSGTHQFYLENIQFLGGTSYSFSCANSAERCVINRCRFSYSSGGNAVTVLANRGTIIMAVDSVASYSRTFDGWNYHDAGGICCDVVEINCVGHHNGLAGGPNNNGSTIHDGGRIIRINGDYSYNQNRNVHDITNGSEVWMLGCQAGDAQIVGGTAYTSANFMFGRDGATDSIKAWLDGCVSRGGSMTDFAIYPGGELKVRATDISPDNFKSVISSGTLSGY